MRRSGLIACVLGCAALAGAQDDAPLADAKQQLRQLKRDQTLESTKAESGQKLREAMPQLQTGRQDPDPAPAAPSPEAGQPDPSRNWLLEGYDRLARKGRVRDPGPDEEDEDAAPLDSKAPDYFLRVYEKQRATRQAGTRERAAGSPLLNAAPPDPFGPFMREWLADSPIKGALRDGIGRVPQLPTAETESQFAAPRDGTLTTRTEEAAGVRIRLDAPGGGAQPAGGVAATAAAPNPYLQALSGGKAADRPHRESHWPVAPQSVGSAGPSVKQPSVVPEEPKTRVRRAPPPSPADEKKYFPQLKKF